MSIMSIKDITYDHPISDTAILDEYTINAPMRELTAKYEVMKNVEFDYPKDNRHLKDAVFAHYDRLLACRTDMDFLTEGWTSDSCPLCAEYDECVECPVALHTTKHHCVGTPWANMDWEIRGVIVGDGKTVLKEPLKEVVDMYEFLKTVDFGVKHK